MFRIGQRVVCIDARPWKGYPGTMPLVKNRIYTVSGIDTGWQMNPGWGVYLAEIKIDKIVTYTETSRITWTDAFNPVRFRPVVEKKTSIAVFAAMLNDAPVLEDA